MRTVSTSTDHDSSQGYHDYDDAKDHGVKIGSRVA